MTSITRSSKDAREIGATSPCVWFVPFGDENPYQRELVAGLRSLGFRIATRNWLSGILLSCLRPGGGPALLHHHWLPRFTPDWLGVRIIVGFVLRIIGVRLLGRKIVWTVHNLYDHEARWRWVDRWVAKLMVACCHRLIVHGPRASRLVQTEFFIRSSDKIVVIPHGNYLESYPVVLSKAAARERIGVSMDAHVVLFFGMIRPYKGVLDLIRAHQRTPREGAVLVIAGKPLDETVVPAIEALTGNDPSIRFRPGFVADEDVQAYLLSADVVVCPFTSVLTSGSVVLAMSFGRACVAPELGCIPDVLDENGGFLYDPNDPDALVRCLGQAYAERDRLETLGAHNLAKAREWSWARVARETAEVFEAALRGRSKGR